MNSMTQVNDQLTNLQLDADLLQRIAQLDNLDLYEVMNLKVDVEKELDKNLQDLINHQADMTSSLLTEEGYPRDDIDVLQVRYIRRNINMLKNDLKQIIEKSYTLFPTHFQSKNSKDIERIKNDNFENTLSLNEHIIPFAVIKEIAEESPVAKAGLNEGDKLICIGQINVSNHSKLRALGPEVKSNEDKSLKVRVQRNDELLNVDLIPTQKWPGTGLLGCKLVEI